jgi:hypothetical protein
MSVAPIVRRVIVCRKVEVTDPGPYQSYTVRGIETSIRPLQGHGFPHREKELWLFAQFSDGAGSHTAHFELIHQHLESEEVVVEFDLPPVHMTSGRFSVLNRGYKLKGLMFPEPGVFEFRIRCGSGLSSDEIRLEESS